MKEIYVLEYYYRVDGYLFKESLGFFATEAKAEQARKKQLALWVDVPPYSLSTIDPYVEKNLLIQKYPMNELVFYERELWYNSVMKKHYTVTVAWYDDNGEMQEQVREFDKTREGLTEAYEFVHGADDWFIWFNDEPVDHSE